MGSPDFVKQAVGHGGAPSDGWRGRTSPLSWASGQCRGGLQRGRPGFFLSSRCGRGEIPAMIASGAADRAWQPARAGIVGEPSKGAQATEAGRGSKGSSSRPPQGRLSYAGYRSMLGRMVYSTREDSQVLPEYSCFYMSQEWLAAALCSMTEARKAFQRFEGPMCRRSTGQEAGADSEIPANPLGG